MQNFARGLTAVVMVSFAYYAGCGADDITGGGTSSNSTVTNGTGYDPACNDGQPDGTCIQHSPLAETCECYDCLGTAFCSGRCEDDGTCNIGDNLEDCTCADCAFMGGECGNAMNGPGPGPGSTTNSTTGGGMGGAGAGGAPSTTTTTTSGGGLGGAGNGGTAGAGG